MTSLGIVGVIIMTAGLVAAIFGFSGSAGIILILLGALIITMAILRSYRKGRQDTEGSFQPAQHDLPNHAFVPVNLDAAATLSSSTHEYGLVPPYTPVPIWAPSGSLEMPYGYPVAPVHYKENDHPPSYSELFGNKT